MSSRENRQLEEERWPIVTPSARDGGVGASLVESAHRNGALNDDTLASIKASCITSLKNIESSGVAIDDEAEIFRETLSDLDPRIDRAFKSAREGRT